MERPSIGYGRKSHNFIDISGQKFNKLTAMYFEKRGNRAAVWVCSCECGGSAKVASYALRTGSTKSCGCYLREMSSDLHTKHGLSAHPLYFRLNRMITRCSNPKNPNYKHYGAKGVTVCREWRENPTLFIEWCLANGYAEGLEIDRIDVTGNYEPSNCRFITPKENKRNKRYHFTIEYKGTTYHAWEIESVFGLKAKTVKARIYDYGMTPEEALTKPLRHNTKKRA